MDGHSLRSMEPAARMRHLTEIANSVKFDKNIPLHRYFRSGNELLRMAEVYMKEGNLENSYILYLKFLTIFIEKVAEHPDYLHLSAAEKALNNAKVKEVFPKTEILKEQLSKRFREEYVVFKQEEEKREERERLQKQQQEAAEKARREREEEERKLLEERKKLVEQGKSHLEQIQIPDSRTPLNLAIYSATSEEPAENLVEKITPAVPEVNRSSKPKSLLSSELRTVILPAALLSEFVILASDNTEKNIETCGILAGHLAQNQFWITHLLIPKQSGSPDSCTTHNEEELFAVQDKHSLITLGWIHTHPTQTAFLSSVDLHTHCSYQLMMPEAVAVVCAPKYNETGFFSLTPNHGLDTIANCQETGFHPHQKDPPLFQVAEHVQVHTQAPISVIDLRKL